MVNNLIIKKNCPKGLTITNRRNGHSVIKVLRLHRGVVGFFIMNYHINYRMGDLLEKREVDE